MSKYIYMKFLQIILLLAVPVSAEVSLPSLFSDGMVLQRQKPIRVWGKGENGEGLTVTFRDESVKATVENGGWMAVLKPCEAGGPYVLKITSDKSNISFKDVLVGDVWICGGQSNMEAAIANSDTKEQAMAVAANPNIRYFTQSFDGHPKLQDDVKNGKWKKDGQNNDRKYFSAIAWHFSQKILEYENVPLGFIKTWKGASHAQFWLPIEDIKGDPRFEEYVKEYETKVAAFDVLKAEYEKQIAEKKKPSQRPHTWVAAFAFNQMIYPMRHFGVKGVLWYQGESNSSFNGAIIYEELMTRVIKAWRKNFNDENLPFLSVQLSSFAGYSSTPNNQNWAILREAQENVAKKLPHTGIALSFDHGEIKNIHPKAKRPVGERLALIALNKVYGKDVEYLGPYFSKVEIKNDKIVVSFDNIGKGITTSDGKNPKSFYISAEDNVFYPAEATIEKETIILRCDKVKTPKHVRYGWLNYVEANLYGKNGLPVPPFRSDNLPHQKNDYYPENPMRKYYPKDGAKSSLDESESEDATP